MIDIRKEEKLEKTKREEKTIGQKHKKIEETKSETQTEEKKKEEKIEENNTRDDKRA